MTALIERPTFEPVCLGPTWRRREDGRWDLPERTLGWGILAWSADNIQHPDGSPWMFTPEQARFVLWLYALNEQGRFLFRDAVLQRLKGWGKDPAAAALCIVELCGPCRFGGWDESGEPIGIEHPTAWIQVAAVSKDQTRNTMTLFPSMFSKQCIADHKVDLGKEIIYAHGGQRRIEAVTSSPRALEGGRPTFAIKNETHHWLWNNDGHGMAEVIGRNATKARDGNSRTLAITNAYEPSEDSVAQRDREAWERIGEAGGILYDSLEAPANASLDPSTLPDVIRAIRGDATWLDIDGICAAVLDPRNPPSQSRRWWLNAIVAAEDAWIDPADFDLCRAGDDVAPMVAGDEVVLFLDCSKSDDATGLVAVRLGDGLVHVLDMWQRPRQGDAGHEGWTTPRHKVDNAVSMAFENYRVTAFFGDPSHVLEDESQERYWDGLFDQWHRTYSEQLEVWAKPGRDGHAVMWDMSSPVRIEQFTAAAERCEQEISEHALLHDGDGRLRRHARNCKRYPNKWGISVWKGHRESARKIDLAVCMIGARMVRRLVLNNPNRKRRRTGKVW